MVFSLKKQPFVSSIFFWGDWVSFNIHCFVFLSDHHALVQSITDNSTIVFGENYSSITIALVENAVCSKIWKHFILFPVKCTEYKAIKKRRFKPMWLKPLSSNCHFPSPLLFNFWWQNLPMIIALQDIIVLVRKGDTRKVFKRPYV